MQYDDTTRTWRGSATDLANHARCEHLTHRTRAREQAIAEGREQRPPRSEDLAMRKGIEFEQAWLAQRSGEVRAAGGRVLDLSRADPRSRREQLEQALRDGVQLVIQAPLRSGTIFGYADVLERDDDGDAPSGTLGTIHRYRPVELKFARSVKVEHLLQLSAYADALSELQGELPRRIDVVTGDGRRHEHLPSEYVDYLRAARERFDAALALDLEQQLAIVPDPVPHCERCDFAPVCGARRIEVDHLSLVAGIRADQRTKLAAVGITTLSGLADGTVERVPGIGRDTLPRLVTQARLQRDSRDGAAADTRIEYRRPAEDEPPGRGFALLPEPHVEDMFFDFEGYPYHESGALEYLWGWTTRDATGTLSFDELWADDPAAEARAFTAFLDEVHARRARSDGRMHVYHYAPYEITALRRLARQHPQELDRLDDLLRAEVFVDLYAVVRQAMQVGRPSYSIKQLEPLYGVSREGDELADGGESIEIYERWLLTGDERVRDTIVAYNRVDCDSTLLLRDWLLEHRERARAEQGIEWPQHPPGAPEQPDADEGSRDPHPMAVLVERLEVVAEDDEQPDDVRLAARLLSAMPGWQRRVRREFFGDLHARKREREAEDFVDEPTALAGLRLESCEQPAGAKGATLLRTYSFPEQVTLVKEGQVALDPTSVRELGTVEFVDLDALRVGIRTTGGQQAKFDAAASAAGEQPGALPEAIVGWDAIRITPLERAAAQVAGQLLECLEAGRDPFAPDEPCAAALSVLARHHTRVSSGSGPEAIGDPPDPLELADLVRRADGSHVIVQGPPGTGKTYTSARLIVALVEAGLRVGISSNSHDAVINVLRGIDRYRGERAAAGDPIELRAAYALRTKERAPGTFGFGETWISRPGSTDDAAALVARGEAQVLAGTAWALAKCEPLDVLLVDEAGQVSLLHLAAMACNVRRIVLVGDPQQLPQPAGTMHPHGCGASTLEHLFEGAAVLPRDRAVLLPVSWRMHPRVCSFVSDAYYRGELRSHESTMEQLVAGVPALPSAGTHLVLVDHHGNRASAPEEVEAIGELVARLLDGGRVVPKPGEPERAVRPTDIIVVAPYNAQRRQLQSVLGPDIRVGTVDRFQGQEAPIAILSMTASSREELPRGLEFLLDPHRLNVAISRARALSIMVASPALLATSARSIEELRLLNDLARFARLADVA